MHQALFPPSCTLTTGHRQQLFAELQESWTNIFSSFTRHGHVL